MTTHPDFRTLSIAIVGGGIGGLAAAVSLRRQGHIVTIYERADFVGEVGASISCAANGTRWLEEWKVNIEMGDPVVLKNLISRDWKTGEPINVYNLDDYKERWGYVYNMFHRQYMHRMLMDSAVGEHGEGTPAKLLHNHKCTNANLETGEIEFENGVKVKHDVIIGADGIGSAMRTIMGIEASRTPAACTCLHANVDADKVIKNGLINYAENDALEYWGGYDTHYKVILSPCNGGKLLSYYCWFPRDADDLRTTDWREGSSVEELLAPYPDLDRNVFKHLEIGYEVRPWRIWIHKPYPFWTKGVATLMGDAAHPMMPDQSQGACQSLEDAAGLGLAFSKKHFNGDVRQALQVYEEVRKPRATKVQAASERARENLNERIGFSSNTNFSGFKVAKDSEKLTIEEMNLYDMHHHTAEVYARRRGDQKIENGFISGLPTTGLEAIAAH